MKILIIEDEVNLRSTIAEYLQKERYVVESAGNCSEALEKVELYDYDCVLLDVMLPDGSGFEILERLKELHKEETVIMISAKDSTEDKVKGLEKGADDYLAKPFHLSELSARIKSVIRRSRNSGEMVIVFGNITLNPSTYSVKVNNNELELNRKEYELLHYFINRPNRVINKSVVAEFVWGDHIDGVDNYDFIYAQIKNLRKKLTDAHATATVKAVYGLGYKFLIEE